MPGRAIPPLASGFRRLAPVPWASADDPFLYACFPQCLASADASSAPTATQSKATPKSGLTAIQMPATSEAHIAVASATQKACRQGGNSARRRALKQKNLGRTARLDMRDRRQGARRESREEERRKSGSCGWGRVGARDSEIENDGVARAKGISARATTRASERASERVGGPVRRMYAACHTGREPSPLQPADQLSYAAARF